MWERTYSSLRVRCDGKPGLLTLRLPASLAGGRWSIGTRKPEFRASRGEDPVHGV